MGRNPDDRITTDVGREICLRDGIKALLTGSIASLGSDYAITLEAVHVSTGETLARQQIQANRKEDVLNALHKAATDLRGQLGESLASVQKYDMPLSQATTSSLDALKALSMGDNKHAMGDEMAAIPNYQRAIELDPMFAMAYARLGAVYNNLGQSQLSETNRQKAFELRDRASEREKLYIMSHYYADGGQLDKGITALELYRQTYPRDSIPHNNLANIYNQLGQFDNALPNAKMSVELSPDGLSGYENLAMAYVGLNRIDEARATLDAALRLKPGSVSLMVASLDWAQGRGDIEKNLQSATSTPDGEISVLKFRLGMAAARGQIRLARDFSKKAQDALDRLRLQGRADIEAELAGLEALVGNRNEAINRAHEAIRLSRTFNVMWNSAVALAAVGQDQQARNLADEIQKTRPNDTIAQNVAVPMTQAIAFLSLSGGSKPQPEKAIDLLNTAALYSRSSSGVLYTRGLAYKQAGRYEEAAQDFQKILDWKPLHGPDQMVPAAQLELGRVYQKEGESAKARVAYQNFLAMWKDADPDVPLLLQAKVEYAKLQ
jgi:tetratricopeptide (TPR) repeat protein